MKLLTITNSYIQNNKFETQSDRYNVINPSAVGQAMNSQGLALQTLSTGRARHADKADFQRTLARYRGPEIGNGIYLDIIHDSKKLGRGCDELLLGIYRVVCTNGLITGKSFSNVRIRHSGDTYEQLNNGIAALLAQKDTLAATIERMQNTKLSLEQVNALIDAAIKLVVPEKAFNVRNSLNKIRRQEDKNNDAWSIFNVVQENTVQGKVSYQLASVNDNGVETVRTYSVRPIKPNTNRDRVVNAALFDAALKLVA